MKETFNNLFHPLYNPYNQELMYMKAEPGKTEFKS